MNPRSHASSWPLLLASSAIVLGCADASTPTSTSSAIDDATSHAPDADDEDDDDDEAPPWSETALGPYYLDLGFPLHPAKYIGELVNVELRPDTLLVTHLQCTGEHSTERFELDFEGDEAFVRPRGDDAWLMWAGEAVAKGLVIRPGPTCSKLVAEFIDPVSPRGPFAMTWSWRRGAVEITDLCVDDAEWSADVSPSVSTECPGEDDDD